MMKIEAGKYYRTRDGRKVGPMRVYGDPSEGIFDAPEPFNYGLWRECGVGWIRDKDDSPTLVAEWADIDLSNPLGVVFGLMPPETQEAMKAHGGPWEVFSYGRWSFWGGAQYEWSSDRAYRVKPAPIRETVVLYGGREGDTAEYGFYETGAVVQSHRISFKEIGGKPDCASIKMEELE